MDYGELLRVADDLDRVARTIQRDTEIGITDEDLAKLVEQYQIWFAECVTVLPDDLVEPFRFEYRGSFFASKIRQFFEAPTKRSVIRQADPDNQLFPYWQYPYETTFRAPLLAQKQLILEASKRRPSSALASMPFDLLERIATKFPLVVAQLSVRKRGKPVYLVEDEYDVQDLFIALVRLFFDDVRIEEPGPSHAGGGTKADVLLGDEMIAVEMKMTRRGLADRAVGEELLVDIQRYRAHPKCQAFFGFVYDPGMHIRNPTGLQADLASSSSEEFAIKIVVVQAGGGGR